MPSRSREDFAPEIWFIIGGYLSKNDLNNLTRLASHYLALFRPILYRNLDLENYHDTIVTIELLCKNKELAKCVRKLTLETPSEINFDGMLMPKPVPACYLTALSNMDSLKTLCLTGSIFNNEMEQNEFVEKVCEGKIPLNKFSFREIPSKLPGSVLPLPRLSSFSWSAVDANCFTQMCSVLESSHETLKSISLRFSVTEEENYLRLWKMRFPQLRSLTLGKWDRDIKDDTDSFTEFVVAHGDTLEILDLDHGDANMGMMEFGSSLKLKKDSLSRLKIFRGHVNVVKQMVRVGMDCLQTSLLKLDAGVDFSESYLVVEDFLDAIFPSEHSKNPFGVLRELKLRMEFLESDDEGSDEMTCGIIERITEFCGKSLEVWLGVISVEIKAERLAGSFSRFEKLKAIHLHETVLLGDDPESYAVKLAERCLQLEEVVITGWGCRYKTISIIRDGAIPRIARVKVS